MKRTLTGLALAAGLTAFTLPAGAAPIAPSAAAPTVGSAAEQVHWRNYRHCHDRGWRVRCHGGYARNHSWYGDGPGFVLRFGGGRSWGDHRGNWRDHHRDGGRHRR